MFENPFNLRYFDRLRCEMMREIVLSLTILCFFTCIGQGSSSVCLRGSSHNYYNDPALVTGIVQAIGRNTIDIFDEEQKKVERFIYFEHGKEFNKGDYVRIYYHPRGAVVQIIKRMTVLKYNMNGQNLGYICR